jgi:hypothetical protein
MAPSLPLIACVFHSFAIASGGYVSLAGNIPPVLPKSKTLSLGRDADLVKQQKEKGI